MNKRKSKNLNCLRMLSRKLRNKVGWTDWHLKSQILTQIFLFVSCFFIVYFTFNISFTSYELKIQVLSLIHDHILVLDFEILNTDTIASTACYQKLEDENE